MRTKITAVVMSLLMLATSACWILSPAFADTNIGSAGIYITVARSLAWSGANQTWIIAPASPNESLCLSIQNNNPTSSHSFTLLVAQTSDPALINYTNNSSLWIPDVVNGSASPVSASSTNNVSVSVSGAANVAIQISGATSASGSPDTVSIFVVQGAPCTSATTWEINSAPAFGARATVSLAAVTGVRHTAQCISASVSSNNTTAACGPTGLDLVIRDGASGAGTIVWQTNLSTPATNGANANVAVCGLSVVGTRGNAMTVEFGTAGAANCLERVNASGIDTQ